MKPNQDVCDLLENMIAGRVGGIQRLPDGLTLTLLATKTPGGLSTITLTRDRSTPSQADELVLERCLKAQGYKLESTAYRDGGRTVIAFRQLVQPRLI